MKNHHLRKFQFCCLTLLTGACVSVNIPTGSGTQAEDVSYSEPSSPYKEIEVSSGDKAWLSSKTGNTISFLSDCNGRNDPSLQELENEALSALNKLKILESKPTSFNAREALATEAQGEMDGVSVKTALLVFKKNNCNYTLTYGGVLKNFDAEKQYFQKFLESFKAP